MRLLLINLCSDPLSDEEFVKPVKNILRQSGIKFFTKHYSKIAHEDVNRTDKIIICGTALKDNAFLENASKFEWIRETEKPILGLGSGLQLIAKVFGNKLIDKVKIGIFRVHLIEENNLINRKVFYSYFLTNKVVKTSEPLKTIAKTGRLECLMKHRLREVYGCLFHPEALNPEVILNFALKI